VVLGPKTNAEYLRAILEHEAFVAGDLSTSFVAQHMAGWKPESGVPPEVLMAAAAGEFLGPGTAAQAPSDDGGVPAPTSWYALGTWRVVDPEEGRAS